MVPRDSSDLPGKPDLERGAARPTDQPAIEQDLFCPECAYNPRGLTSDRCPECGYDLESIRAPVSGIPWVYRKEMGRFRAYWKTVGLVMFRQKRFCDEMARPVSYADSQSFRWVTVLHTYLPVLPATFLQYGLAWPAPFDEEVLDFLFSTVWPIGVVHVAILLFLAAATGVPSYFFHPRGAQVALQNRAIALSYYACGPLAVTALPLAAAVIGVAVGPDRRVGLGFMLIAALVPMGQVLAWWTDLVRINRRVMPQRKGATVLVEMLLPVLWLALGALILVGLPLVVSIVLLVFGNIT